MSVFMSNWSSQLPKTTVSVAALFSEALVIAILCATSIGFLWYNVIGCAAVVVISAASRGLPRPKDHVTDA
jgi:hypothetical protein